MICHHRPEVEILHSPEQKLIFFLEHVCDSKCEQWSWMLLMHCVHVQPNQGQQQINAD